MNGGGGAAAVAARRPSSQQVRRRRRQRCGCIAYASSAPDNHGHGHGNSNNDDDDGSGRSRSHGHGAAQNTSASDGDGGGNCSGGGGSLRFSAKAVQSTISAVAGIAVAAAVGGTLIYSRRVWHAFRRLVRHTGLVIRQAFFKSWNCRSCEVSSKRFGSRQLQLSCCLIYEKIHLTRRRKKYPRLMKEHWENAFDPETGCLNNTHKVLKRIRYGGIDPGIRAQVWPFLLGMYGFDSTLEERAAQRVFKREEYENLRRQCSYMRSATMSKARQAMVEVDLIDLTSELDMEGMASNYNESANNNKKKNEVKEEEEGFGTWQRIIRLDASRMDTECVLHSPFESDGGGGAGSGGRDLDARRERHAARLIAILEAYAVYDPETGYCQGMGDLLSPFVALLEEDFEAFWCFACFMEAIRHNFRIDEMGIQRQLSAVSRIIGVGDPPLYHYLEQIEAQDCMFVYRMVVVLMRRELSFKQTVSLWEVVWADKASAMLAEREGLGGEVGMGDGGGDDIRRKSSRRKVIPPPTDDLLLYVIAAAVCQKRKLILNKCTCMDDVLRECNSMAGHLDVWSLLDDARGLLFAALHDKTS